jgi:hypothetical protein
MSQNRLEQLVGHLRPLLSEIGEVRETDSAAVAARFLYSQRLLAAPPIIDKDSPHHKTKERKRGRARMGIGCAEAVL